MATGGAAAVEWRSGERVVAASSVREATAVCRQGGTWHIQVLNALQSSQMSVACLPEPVARTGGGDT